MIWIWTAVLAAALVLEAITQELVSIWFVPGALAALILAFFDASLYLQIPTAIVLSLICLIFLRRMTMKVLKKETMPTNKDSLIGKQVVLITSCHKNEPGTVKLNGVIWNAVSNDEITAGSEVEILEISGNKLKVRKVD